MANPRLTPEMARLTGADRANPSRYPELREKVDGAQVALPPAPQGEPFGDPPADLTKEKLAVWRELFDQTPKGMLEKSDRAAFALAVDLLLIVRTEKMKPKDYSNVVGRLVSVLASMGMTPAARQRLRLPASSSSVADDNPFKDFAKN